MRFVKKINIPIYPCTLHFVLTDEYIFYDELKDKFNIQNDLSLSYFKGLASESGLKGGEYIIFINLNRLTDYLEILTTIRHETHHICAYIWEYIGEETMVLDNEPFMYLCDYVYSECLKIYFNYNK